MCLCHACTILLKPILLLFLIFSAAKIDARLHLSLASAPICLLALESRLRPRSPVRSRLSALSRSWSVSFPGLDYCNARGQRLASSPCSTKATRRASRGTLTLALLVLVLCGLLFIKAKSIPLLRDIHPIPRSFPRSTDLLLP